jgi:hypothetical protein
MVILQLVYWEGVEWKCVIWHTALTFVWRETVTAVEPSGPICGRDLACNPVTAVEPSDPICGRDLACNPVTQTVLPPPPPSPLPPAFIRAFGPTEKSECYGRFVELSLRIVFLPTVSPRSTAAQLSVGCGWNCIRRQEPPLLNFVGATHRGRRECTAVRKVSFGLYSKFCLVLWISPEICGARVRHGGTVPKMTTPNCVGQKCLGGPV